MKITKVLVTVLMLIFSISSYGSVKNQIKELEQAKVEKVVVNYKLPNNKSVNLEDWQLVIFMQSTCPYCKKFDPIIKKVADNMKLKTFVFSFDGMSEGTFETVYPVTNDIVANFFRDLPVATPTTFLVNVNTLVTAPVSQGEMLEPDFINRINNTFIALLEEK